MSECSWADGSSSGELKMIALWVVTVREKTNKQSITTTKTNKQTKNKTKQYRNILVITQNIQIQKQLLSKFNVEMFT